MLASRGAAILFVICMQDEQHGQRPLEHGIRLEFELGRLEHHVEEIAFVAHDRCPDTRMACPRYAGTQMLRLSAPSAISRWICFQRDSALKMSLGVRIEGPESTQREIEHAHRMGVS